MPNTFSGKGNLANEPSLKTVDVGGERRNVVNMRVFFDEWKVDGEGEIVPDGGFFMGVSIWGSKGENVQKLLKKGARVNVEGQLKPFKAKDEETGFEYDAFSVAADDISLSLSRVEEIKFKPKRQQTEEVPA